MRCKCGHGVADHETDEVLGTIGNGKIFRLGRCTTACGCMKFEPSIRNSNHANPCPFSANAQGYADSYALDAGRRTDSSMTPQFQQRHQDYLFTLPALAPGAVLTGLPLVLDPDAPFVLRSRALRIPYNASREQAGLQFLNMRYAGPNNDYRAQAMVPQSEEMVYFGQMGNPKPVWPNVQYPASGTILVDVQNTSASLTLTGVQLLFRGVKLFPYGSMPTAGYPKRCALQPFIYPQLISNLPVTQPANTLQQIFQVKPDADFVLRSVQAGPALAPLPFEYFIQFLDENLKPYSNAPIHLDFFAGNSAMGNTYPVGPTPTYLPPVGTGASNPGVFFPELYIPRQHILYYYISRGDGAYGGAATLNLPISFNGVKVFNA